MKTIATATILLVLTAAAAGQSKHIGAYKLKPQLLHPSVLSELPRGERPADGLKLAFHESVPLEVELLPGKRPGEYGVKSTPRLPIRKFILPALLNVKLNYGKRRQRQHRWEVYQSRDGVAMKSHTGSWLRVARHEIFFLDLDHDGAFGGAGDGYAVKPPKTKQWSKYGQPLDSRSMTQALVLDGEKVWFEVSADGFQALITGKRPEYAIEKSKDYGQALEYLNGLRAKLGFEPVALDPALSAACEEHSLYCATNGQTHYQEKDKPGYSAAGARAGKAGVLTRADSMKRAIEYWLTSFFHRIYMLHPGLRAVGMGLVQGSATMDVLTTLKRGDHEPYCWPYDGQDDVLVSWLTGESPNPLGGDAPFDYGVASRYGYPITLTFPQKSLRTLTGVTTRLLKGEEELSCFVSTPESPSQAKFASNFQTVFLMSDHPLSPKTTYTVEVKGSWKDEPFGRRWSFTTK